MALVRAPETKVQSTDVNRNQYKRDQLTKNHKSAYFNPHRQYQAKWTAKIRQRHPHEHATRESTTVSRRLEMRACCASAVRAAADTDATPRARASTFDQYNHVTPSVSARGVCVLRQSVLRPVASGAFDPVAWEAEQAVSPPAAKKRKEQEKDEAEKAGKKRTRASLPTPAKKRSQAAVKSEDEEAEEAEGDGEGGAEEGDALASKKPKIANAIASALNRQFCRAKNSKALVVLRISIAKRSSLEFAA
ncbi:hypothetical protein B0H14DRAFT_2605146 [Mycena olivaceomarginata]|nr:hypothetical protein B0H14DRAFT_2605146 [Mycena olivaceomarginata]